MFDEVIVRLHLNCTAKGRCHYYNPPSGEDRRRIERMMSRCFTWFPFGGFSRTQYINQLTLLLIQKLYRRKLQPILQTLLQVV